MARTYEIMLYGTTYTYRGLTRKELEIVQAIESSLEAEDYVCKLCVLSPENINWDESIAALPSKLAEGILEVSGVSEKGVISLQNEVEEWMNTPAGKQECLMMGILGMSLEDIKNLDIPDWFKAAGAAQLLAASLYNLDIAKYMSLDLFGKQPKQQGKITMPPANNPSGKILPPPLKPAIKLPSEILEKDLPEWKKRYSPN
jgi:hypothetical protein